MEIKDEPPGGLPDFASKLQPSEWEQRARKLLKDVAHEGRRTEDIVDDLCKLALAREPKR